MPKIIWILSCALLLVWSAGCGKPAKTAKPEAALEAASEPSTQGEVTIGAKAFVESEVLGQMLALLAEREGFEVEFKKNLGSNLAFEGLKSGDLDAYVDYTGTITVNYFKHNPDSDAAKTLAQARKDLEPAGVAMLDPLGFNNTYTMTMRREQAQKLGVAKISDLAAHAGEVQAGFDAEFMKRPDGYQGMCTHYGFRFEKEPKQIQSDMMYKFCADGEVDLICGFATDGRIDQFDLVVLEDDKHFFPPYDAAPVVRAVVLDEHPKLRAAFEELAGSIDAAQMRKLTLDVSEEKMPVRQVAESFLKKKGILK